MAGWIILEVAVSGRDVTGYLKDPTVWQFKAAREANLRPGELVAEVEERPTRGKGS